MIQQHLPLITGRIVFAPQRDELLSTSGIESEEDGRS
jgi:hypothetical protein